MNRRILLLSALVGIIFALLGLGACDKETIPPPHEHAFFEVETQAPTCGDVGYEAHLSCSCGKIFDADHNEIDPKDIEIPATGEHISGTEWTVDSEPTCITYGRKHKTCTVCGQPTEIEEIPLSDEHTFDGWAGDAYEHWRICTLCEEEFDRAEHKYENRVCGVCEADKPVWYYTKDNQYICFGEYPQSRVTDQALIDTLDGLAGDLPDVSHPQNWTDYGYLSGNQPQSYAWYIDISYDFCRYRGVYFLEYRPKQTQDTVGHALTNITLDLKTVYWFKFEPIRWRTLEKSDGTALLLSDLALDAHEYYGFGTENRNLDGRTVYPNDYEYSSIREFVTGTFYDTAFDAVEKAAVQRTHVDNTVASSLPGELSEFYAGYTDDYVFLPSIGDLTDTSYGFDADPKSDDAARCFFATDYALAQGCEQRPDVMRDQIVSVACYYTRSPLGFFEDHKVDGHTYVYSMMGNSRAITQLYLTYEGVLPMLRLNLNS